MARDQGGTGNSVGLAEPGLHRHQLPHRLVAERGEELAEVLDLGRAGKNFPQHQKPLVTEGLR